MKLSFVIGDKSVLSPIISDIRGLVGSFEKITFDFVRRFANFITHALVTLGQAYDDPRFWVEEAPHSVEQASVVDWARWVDRR